MYKLKQVTLWGILFFLGGWIPSIFAAGQDSLEIEITDPWGIAVTIGNRTESLFLDPQEYISIVNERYDSLPLFNTNAAGWNMGVRLNGVIAYECTVFGALLPGTTVSLEPNGVPLSRGIDYEINEDDGCIGRLEGGVIDSQTPVYISYKYASMRLDSIIQRSDGTLKILKGTPHIANPVLPEIESGDIRLANIYYFGTMKGITSKNLYPIISPVKPQLFYNPCAKEFLPKSWEKLTRGEPIRILAWGDSVTECGYLPPEDRWQIQFVQRLQEQFPQAKIELITEAWGGRNTDSYFAEPTGSAHNYKEKVLDIHPDLIISEFVNDSGFDQGHVLKNYSKIRDDFAAIGAEWIILTPHLIRPSWMGLTEIPKNDEDPRLYTHAIREFAQQNKIALADGTAYYGTLWRRGIPYITLMTNNINHPNRLGMEIFVEALMELFQDQD